MYCGGACQKKDWKRHREVCTQSKETACEARKAASAKESMLRGVLPDDLYGSALYLVGETAELLEKTVQEDEWGGFCGKGGYDKYYRSGQECWSVAEIRRKAMEG